MKLWRICKECILSDGRHFVRLVRVNDGPIASGAGETRFAALRAAVLRSRWFEEKLRFMTMLREGTVA